MNKPNNITKKDLPLTELDLNLHVSLKAGMLVKSKLYLSLGANINKTFDGGQTLLLQAVGHFDQKRVKFLLDNKADVNAVDIEGTSALLRSLKYKQWELGDKKADRLNIVEMLIAHGADVNAVSQNRSCLFTAAFNGDLAMVKTLISAGANIENENPKDLPPILGAAIDNNAEVLSYMLDLKPKLTAMYAILTSNHKGNPVPSKKSIGYHLLFSQLNNKNVSLTEKILNAGVDIESQIDGGFTRLSKACELGQTDMVNMLIARGANINHQDAEGNTPIMIAVDQMMTKACRLLVESGADLTLINHKNETVKQMVDVQIGVNNNFLQSILADLRSSIDHGLLMALQGSQNAAGGTEMIGIPKPAKRIRI